MADFTIIGMRVICEVARSGSFSAAADNLGYTQSAVSRQIAATEAAAGQALFERHRRGVRTTTAGDVLVRRALAVVSELEQAREELRDVREEPVGRLRVGAFATATADLLPRAIAAYAIRAPKVEVKLREGLSSVHIRALTAGRIDLAVVTAPGRALRGVTLTPLIDDSLLLAVDRGHRLAERSSVAADELADEAWVAASTESDGETLGAWTASAWTPTIGYVARDWTAKLGLVAAGLAVTVVPGLAVAALPSSIRVVRIEHPAALRTTALARAPSGAADPVVAELSEALRDAAIDIAKETRARIRN